LQRARKRVNNGVNLGWTLINLVAHISPLITKEKCDVEDEGCPLTFVSVVNRKYRMTVWKMCVLLLYR
jgi:hypothetical protein